MHLLGSRSSSDRCFRSSETVCSLVCDGVPTTTPPLAPYRSGGFRPLSRLQEITSLPSLVSGDPRRRQRRRPRQRSSKSHIKSKHLLRYFRLRSELARASALLSRLSTSVHRNRLHENFKHLNFTSLCSADRVRVLSKSFTLVFYAHSRVSDVGSSEAVDLGPVAFGNLFSEKTPWRWRSRCGNLPATLHEPRNTNHTLAVSFSVSSWSV